MTAPDFQEKRGQKCLESSRSYMLDVLKPEEKQCSKRIVTQAARRRIDP